MVDKNTEIKRHVKKRYAEVAKGVSCCEATTCCTPSSHVRVLNRLNEAKTSRWNALLEFRLATETLRIDENGAQHDDTALHEPSSAPSEETDSP